MGVAQKNKRKIQVNCRQFFWRVIDQLPGYALQVISADKHFLVQYPLGTYHPFCLLEVIGKDFPGLLNAGHCVIRIHCPQFDTTSMLVTPETVRRLIDWCYLPTKELILVDILGKPISKEEKKLSQ